MSLTNRVSLIGFLGKDAEVKTTRNNAHFTVLSLATKRSWKDRETGEWQSKSTWHRIICWGRLADYAAGFATVSAGERLGSNVILPPDDIPFAGAIRRSYSSAMRWFATNVVSRVR